jgi:hypothetical protein
MPYDQAPLWHNLLLILLAILISPFFILGFLFEAALRAFHAGRERLYYSCGIERLL